MINLKNKTEIPKYILVSAVTFFTDYCIYLLVYPISKSIAISIVMARAVALIVQFCGNKFFVFQSEKNLLVQFTRYLILVIMAGGLSILINQVLINILPYYTAKLLAEVTIFIINFFIMKNLIFKKNSKTTEVTDWSEYYQKKQPQMILHGRKVHENLLVSILKDKKFKNALEFGGANSKIAERFSKEFNLNEFLIVDSNEYGLKITQDNIHIKNLATKCASIFDIDIHNKYDLVYSIGLIEHFSIEGTRNCIHKHVQAVRNNGYVLISFPTPTLQYRILRFGFEVLGLWQFTDERPLRMEEVVKELEKYGEIKFVTINYKLLMTQGIVLMKKDNKSK